MEFYGDNWRNEIIKQTMCEVLLYLCYVEI